MPNSTQADIAVLKSQMNETLKRLDTLASKLDEQSLKIDSQGSTFIMRGEWNEWKRSQQYQKVLLSLIVAIVTATIISVVEVGVFHK